MKKIFLAASLIFSITSFSSKGLAQIRWEDGSYEERIFENDKANGPFKYVDSKGFVIKGNYVNDLREGPAIISYDDGTYIFVNYVNGILNGEYKLVSPKDNYTELGIYENGVKIKK